MPKKYCIGVDVGTGSVRAGIFTLKGTMISNAAFNIKMWRPETDFVEQSSEDIWKNACRAVKTAMKDAEAIPEDVVGIGFDATCSLVCVDKEFNPLTVSPTGKNNQNVIVWMDHRAIDQVERINKTGHKVLKYVGGAMSPEMEPPKLLWLKENMKNTWKYAGKFFDLADYMSFRATGDDTRSLCTVVCKWTYQGHLKNTSKESVGRWDDSFWREIGLGEIVEEEYERIGNRIRPMGESVGKGLARESARDMGLEPGTPVGVGIIDAHAGGVGMLGATLHGKRPTPGKLENRLALIGGTSSCHMAVSREPKYIKGIWGPYFSAMFQGLWLTEGGQSATDSLIDYALRYHPWYAALKKEAKHAEQTPYEYLNNMLDELAKEKPFRAALTQERHVLPNHHGNRSPLADPTLKGVHTGLKLDDSPRELALQYLATIQGVAYGTRHIIEEMNKKGYTIKNIFACGGGTRNRIFLQEHADATGCRIVIPKEPEAVLLGGALLGAVASKNYPNVLIAMAHMNKTGKVIVPRRGNVQKYHDMKYRVFKEMYKDFMKYRKMMKPEKD